MDTPLLEMKNITKEFPGVKALNNVSFRVAAGEIHCLVGENGAGKSTLMKVLSGVYPHGDYSGQILINGQEQQFHGIRDSEKAGIAIIYQELALFPELTVYENIFVGNENRKGAVVDWNETIKRANEMLAKVRLNVNPGEKIKNLGVGKQQLVEIAKALSKEVKLLILDEPTAALNEDDSANLLDLLRGLKDEGVTSIMISHKLKEVISIADTVTVLRDGQTICTLDAHKGEVSEFVLIKNMVGREINNIYPERQRHPFKSAAMAVEAAKSAGVKVISYDRLITNTEALDYYVTFDSIAVGALQAEYLAATRHGQRSSAIPVCRRGYGPQCLPVFRRRLECTAAQDRRWYFCDQELQPCCCLPGNRPTHQRAAIQDLQPDHNQLGFQYRQESGRFQLE